MAGVTEPDGLPWRTTLARAIRKPAWAQGNYFYVGVVQHIGGTLVDCPHKHLSEAAANLCAKQMARKLNKPGGRL